MPPLALIALTLVAIGIVLLMRPKRFYFIRHGETLLNAQHIKQGAEGALSESGKQQAATVGELLAPLGIKKIIASPYERAKETATIISGKVHAPIIYTPLLIERRNATELIGKSTRDPEVIRIVDEMDLAYHEDDYRYSDEENFQDLKIRAQQCLWYLAKAGRTQNCVVTHHAFLKMLLSYMLYREDLHLPGYVKLSFFNTSDNGGISVCEFHPWKIFSKTRGWEILSYNEQPNAQ